MTARLSLTLLTALLACSIVSAQKRVQVEPGSVPAVLARALKAAPKLRYSGTRVVETKFGPERVRHTEFVIRSGGSTRVEFPADGPFSGQVIVETGRERRHYLPDKKIVRVLPPRREEAYERLLKMMQGRRKLVWSVGSGDEVAGYRTQLIVMSREEGGVMQKIWVEPRTGMMLKREMYDRTGNLQALSEFTRIDFRPTIHPSDFLLQPAGARIVTPRDDLQEIVSQGAFLDVSLPASDAMKLEQARVMKFGDQRALLQIYVSPQGRVSLFQVRSTIDPERLKRTAHGEFKTISWQKNGSSFVLVGDLPEDQMRRIAQRLGG